ncbi:MAG TPA: hypothetical protein VFE51_04420 [Verrucomicrobiae bacterium]|nr:hypothetical protein [Verrucomicrobiae bacterium]
MFKLGSFVVLVGALLASVPSWVTNAAASVGPFEVVENPDEIRISSAQLGAVIHKRGYVTGVAGGSFLDKKSGFHDAGFGLDIVDWIMEPGSDAEYRSQLQGDLAYDFNNLYHGKRPKRSIEGPQICTQAKELSPRLIQGQDFLAVQTSFQFRLAAPGKKPGSKWTQTIVFPAGKRYFVSSDSITSVNASEAMFLRLDMPGHIRHQQGDTFTEVYLSYLGHVNASEFFTNFPPDGRFIYRRGTEEQPKRFIRAYHLRNALTGQPGPWLAGMTLDPSMVSEAWCHQRDYVCMIEEVGGRPIQPGQSFSAAFIVGFFDSIEEMQRVYDQYAGTNALYVDKNGWKLSTSVAERK